MNDTFQKRLKIERTRLRLSQESFGALGGVAKTTQYFYESGRAWPTCKYLDELRKNNVDVCYLVSGKRMDDALDWGLLEQAVSFVFQSSQGGAKETFASAEEMYEAIKIVYQAAAKIKQKEPSLSEGSKTIP